MIFLDVCINSLPTCPLSKSVLIQVSAVESGGSNTTDALIQEKDGEVTTNLEKRRSIDDLSR